MTVVLISIIEPVLAMKPIRILVNSPGEKIGSFLEEHLPLPRFSVYTCKPGSSFMEMAESAEIAVIDEIDIRPNAAQLEIALLKKLHHNIPIIVISKKSSDQDVNVVEQGIFYYLAGNSNNTLLRVINAAANVIYRKEIKKPS